MFPQSIDGANYFTTGGIGFGANNNDKALPEDKRKSLLSSMGVFDFANMVNGTSVNTATNN